VGGFDILSTKMGVVTNSVSVTYVQPLIVSHLSVLHTHCQTYIRLGLLP
jgi:hypothetical protein